MNIIVNGKDCPVGSTAHLTLGSVSDSLSYDDIILVAGFNRGRILSVTYTTRRKGDEQRQGILSPGKSVRIEDGMIFNVADTGNA